MPWLAFPHRHHKKHLYDWCDISSWLGNPMAYLSCATLTILSIVDFHLLWDGHAPDTALTISCHLFHSAPPCSSPIHFLPSLSSWSLRFSRWIGLLPGFSKVVLSVQCLYIISCFIAHTSLSCADRRERTRSSALPWIYLHSGFSSYADPR